jgi:hypothetical protein
MSVDQIINNARNFFLTEDPTLKLALDGIDDHTSSGKLLLKLCCSPFVTLGKGTGLFMMGTVETATAIFTEAIGLCSYPVYHNSLATRSWKYIQDGRKNMMLGFFKVFPVAGNIRMSKLKPSRLSRNTHRH